MTISTTIIKNSYSGDGSVVAFTYAFKIADATFIQVIVKTNATGAESVRAIGTGSTNYAVTGVGEAGGGTVTFVTAPTSAETVVLRRSTTQTQALDLIENDNLPANSLETAFDKNLSIAQELQEQIDRSIKISRANAMTSTEFTVSATDRANKVLSFDASGEIAVAQELGTFKGTSATTTTAAYVVRDLVKGSTTAQLNNIYICIQASPIGTALTNTSYWVLIVDAVSAAASATTATTKASEAATSASTATTKAAEAVTAKDASVVAKDASVAAKDLAVTAKNEAVTAKNAAETALDSFDDLYLGAKSSAPSVDNDGDALTTGDQYFNSSTNQLNVWNGSAWIAITTPEVTLAGTETLTNKTLTAPKINENVAVTSTATELNLLDGKAATNLALVGKQAGTSFTNSLLIGHATTGTLSSANGNIGIGLAALDALTSGDNNIGIGYGAATSINSGSLNTIVGAEAGNVPTSGIGNSFYGQKSGRLTSGSYNTLLGNLAGENLSSGSGNVLIGHDIDAASNTGDRQLVIAGNDNSTTTTWITGDSSGNLVTPGTITANSVVLTGVAADNSITLAKMAGGTDGNIISYDASGDPVAIATGSDGQVLTSTGAGSPPAFEDAAESGLAWQTIVTGSTLTAVAGRGYWINTSSNACTITLPSSASAGDQLIFTDYARTWGTNAVTINQNGLNFQGGTVNPVYNTSGQSVDLVYSGATNGWIPNSDDDVTNEPVTNPLQRGIIYGGHSAIRITNLISNSGVVSADVSAVASTTGRHNLAASSFGGDRAIFAYGFFDGGSQLSMSNLTDNNGVISADVTGVGTARSNLGAVGYGYNKGLFAFGAAGGQTNVSNKVSSAGVVASDTTGVGTAKASVAGTTFGKDKGIFAYGSASSRTNTRNLVNNLGVVATTVAGAGTARAATAGTTYGEDLAIFAYGGVAGSGVTDGISLSNKVSNLGVIAADVTGVGTARYELIASPYGGDKGAFAYGAFTDGGQTVQTISIKNLVSNTGVIAADVAGVGTVRKQAAAAGYST